MAEIRSTANTPTQPDPGFSSATLRAHEVFKVDPTASPETELPKDKDGRPTIQAIPSKNGRHRRKYQKRQPVGPSDTDIARDGIVDQIMRDGAVPIYDNLNAHAVPDDPASDHDRDAAAITAFKVEFLASMEDQKYARKPANAAPATNGPKLGGSRMARERMKALEEQTKAAPRNDQR